MASGRLTSTRSQKITFPSSEQLTTCVSRSLRQQSSLYSWFLWPVYLGVGGWVGSVGLGPGGRDRGGMGPMTPRTHSPSSSPVSLSRSRNVESRLDTRMHCPSRLKQVQVIGPGGRDRVGRPVRLGPPLLSLPPWHVTQPGHTHCPRSLRIAAPSSGHSA